MAEFKHLCMAKFKEGVVVDDIIQELTKLAAELDTVKYFGWYATTHTYMCMLIHTFLLKNFVL